MEKRTMELSSRIDQQRLETMIVTPENPKGILQISHGMCEHKERYLSFMEYMAENGFVCVIHDHRGHGRSVNSQQDLGYFNKHGGENLVEDVYLVTEKIKSIYPHLPLVLFGHSMGALIARCYMKKYDDELAGLVICGCPSKRRLLNMGRILSKVMQIGRGERRRSSLMNHLVLGDYERPYKLEGANAWLCSDKEVIKQYNEDPLCNFLFTLNGYESLIWLSNHAYSNSGWRVNKPQLPIRIMSGSKDPCILNKECFQAGVNLIRQAGYEDVTSFLYEDMRHEILNEKDKARVYEDIVRFCNAAL